MIRVAAVGDVHFSEDSRGKLRDYWSRLHECADMLLIAGDLTTHGEARQVEVLADELDLVQVPVVAVLGNHDYHSDEEKQVRRALERRRITVLECESVTLEVNGVSVGIAGTKGFGGGFAGACATPFGEREMKTFIHHTERLAARLEEELSGLRTDYRIALLHYSPVKETLAGERLEIYPFLGSYLLAEAIDSAGADLALHGHAHHGQEKGITPGGVPVRNVALPVLRHAYAVYQLAKSELDSSEKIEAELSAGTVCS
ncbi:MAG TPA: metallophosphoesterase [Blastocatellia bacterium]|nr:metallophosphoesterase [Blastocatellia bacterium]